MADEFLFPATPTPPAVRKQPPTAGTIVKTIAIVLLFLIVMGIAGLMGYMNISSLKDLVRLGAMGADIVRTRLTKEPPFGGKSHVNILILGTDVEFGNSMRTDLIKLLSVDVNPPHMAILSIPRDTWVTIPGHGENRINTAYQDGALDERNERNISLRIASARDAVSGLLSDVVGEPVTIDRTVRMQTEGFVKIIDTLGGVDINVEKQMDYEDRSQGLIIHLKPGLQHLNGYNAMCYVRFRHDLEGDFTRMRRQDQFLSVLGEKVAKMDKTGLATLAGPLLDMTRTDLSASDLLALIDMKKAAQAGPMFSAQLPTTPTVRNGAKVVEVTERANAARTIRDIIHTPRPTVSIMATGGHYRMAQTVADKLNPDTYNMLATPVVSDLPTTSTVFAGKTHEQEADTLAAELGITLVDTTNPPPGPKLTPKQTSPPNADLTVVLADDFTLPGLTAAPSHTASPTQQLGNPS